MVKFRTSCDSNSKGLLDSAYASAAARVRVKTAIRKRVITPMIVKNASAVYGLSD
jgi:hypothetical protein